MKCILKTSEHYTNSHPNSSLTSTFPSTASLFQLLPQTQWKRSWVKIRFSFSQRPSEICNNFMTTNYRRVPQYCILLPYSKVFNCIIVILSVCRSFLCQWVLRCQKYCSWWREAHQSLGTHSPAHHKCKMHCPNLSHSERKCRAWVLAQRWLSRPSSTCVFHIFHKGHRTREEWGQNKWYDKNPTKQASTLTRLQVRRKWGTHGNGCSSLQTDCGHQRLPVMLPPLPTRPGHRSSNTWSTSTMMFYPLIFLNSNKSAYILSEIHCLKYCIDQKSQVNCYILQILQNATAIMSLSIICSKYFM